MRLIDADALKKDLTRFYDNEVTARQLIDAQPTITPEPHWIPCSERLPEEHKVVLTQAQFKDDVKMAVSSRVDFNYWTGWGTRDINVVAWMPLPESYKEGREE